MKYAWILTFEVNEYDQCGEYFMAVWARKPTKQQLRKYSDAHEGEIAALIDHIHAGGGRIRSEHTWYHLCKVMLE